MSTIAVKSYAEFVGVLPRMLGFTPVRSVALVGLSEPSEDSVKCDESRFLCAGQVTGVAVYEIERVGADVGRAWVRALRDLAGAGASGVVVVIFEGVEEDAASIAPGLAAARETNLIEIHEVVRVVNGRAYTVDDLVLDAGGDVVGVGVGTVVPVGADLDAAAEFVAQGRPAPAASVQELAETYRAGSAHRDYLDLVEIECRALEQWTPTRATPQRVQDERAARALAGLCMVLDPAQAAVSEFPAKVLASAVDGLSDVRVRDAVLRWVAPGLMPVEEASGDPVLEALGRALGVEAFEPGSAEERFVRGGAAAAVPRVLSAGAFRARRRGGGVVLVAVR